MKAIVWLCLAIATGVYICGPVIDPDLWWHITFGKWIISHASIPSVDYWNMWGAGKPWRAYSWAPEIVYALVDRWGGAHGLIALQLLSAVLLSLSLFYVLSRLSNDWFIGALLGVWSTAACFNHFTLRPQVLVWIYFAFLLLVAELIEQNGPKRLYLGASFLLMALWANTHLSAIIGLLALFMWLFHPKNVRPCLMTCGVGLLGTLVTPYFGGEWATLVSKSGHPFQHRVIAEFQSATLMQYSTAFIIILLALLLAFWHQRPKTAETAKLLLVLIFTAGGLAVVKFLPFAAIAVAAVIAIIWQREKGCPKALGNLAEAIQRLRLVVNKVPREGLSFFLICVAIAYGISVWRNPIEEKIVPVKALDFIIENKLAHPLLNDFGRGGYVMYRLSDEGGNLEHLVPIDGRTNVTPHDVFEKFLATLSAKRNWHEYVDLVKPKTILWPNDSPFITLLLMNHDWCQVFESGDSEFGYSVFVSHEQWSSRMQALPSRNCREL